MNIIGFNYNKISAEKNKNINQNLEIKNNLEITDIEKEKISFIQKGVVLKFSFKLTIKYEPSFANLTFKGFILVVVDEKKSKELLKKWKKKQIPEDIRILLFNIILTRTSLKALELEEELNLPPHIPLPKLTQTNKDTNKNYVG